MNQTQLEKAKTPKQIKKLLDKVESHLTEDYHTTAYNFLVEYVEFPEWFASHEGGRVILLSLEVLRGIKV